MYITRMNTYRFFLAILLLFHILKSSIKPLPVVQNIYTITVKHMQQGKMKAIMMTNTMIVIEKRRLMVYKGIERNFTWLFSA
jgi:hypothetical protein